MKKMSITIRLLSIVIIITPTSTSWWPGLKHTPNHSQEAGWTSNVVMSGDFIE